MVECLKHLSLTLFMKKFLVVFCLLFAGALHAQRGVLSGLVIDENGFGMPGANIVLEGKERRTVTDVQGNFRFTNLGTGQYDVIVTFIGYTQLKQTVNVQEGQTTFTRVVLKAASANTGGVMVVGDRMTSQAKALNQQRSRANITNIVAADQIGRFPDANIGDAMKRIPGITVLNDQGEARFGLIRGTEPRFNAITINGERMPSAESGTRTVQLDLIPSDMVQTIEVNKAVTSDMDADAIGGSANLVTRAAANGLRVSGALGSGYNFLRQYPMTIGSVVLANRFFNNKLGVVLAGSYHNHNFGSDNVEFSWDYNATTGTPFLTQKEIRKYNVQRIRRSGSVSLDYKLGKNSTLTFRSLYNLRDDFENRFRVVYSGMAQPDANGLTRGRVEIETKGGGEDQRLRRQERQITTANTLGGDHLISGKFHLTWFATYAYAQEDRPNERYISFRTSNLPLASGLRPNTSNPEFAFVEPSVPINYSTLPFRRFQLRNDFTDERDLNGRFNLEFPLRAAGDFFSRLKVGAAFLNKWKEVRQDRGLLTPGTAVTWDALRTTDLTDPNFQANGGGTTYRLGRGILEQELQGFENRFNATYAADTRGNQEASFSGRESINAGYAMLSQGLGRKWSMVAGVRIENTVVTYDATQFDENDVSKPISGGNNYTNVLPGIHLKYLAAENTIVRAAWTNTLARPNYADLAPTRVVDLTDQTISTGNPNLKPTRSMNLDLMAEQYFKKIGILSGGVFYKKIRDFIYTTSIQNFVDPITGELFLNATTPLNGPNANLLGFEVAVQRQLDFLPGFLKNFGVFLNYTYTGSDADVVFFNENTGKSSSINTPLPGTSKHNYNASLSYDSKRLQARVSVNYHSGFLDPEESFLALASSPVADRRFLDEQLHVDANASYKFSKNWRVFVEANNLTNQPLRFYQGVARQTMQSEFYRARVQFGVKFDFFKPNL